MVVKNKKITRGEALSVEILKKRFNLDLEKILEGKNKTPDFYLKNNGKSIAVVEVKDLEEITPTIKNTYDYKQNYLGVWVKGDNCASRISKKINEAHKQLKNNSLPKIILFVNFSLSLDALDLRGTLDGYLLYSSKSGIKVNNLTPYNKVNSSLKNKFKDIDVYLWIETNVQKIKNIGYDILFYRNNKKLDKYFLV